MADVWQNSSAGTSESKALDDLVVWERDVILLCLSGPVVHFQEYISLNLLLLL